MKLKFSFVIIFLFSNFAFATPKPVKLGFITDLTGIGAYWGTQSQRGLTMAKDDIEKEGGKFELLVTDHSFDTMTALSEAQKLINVDRVDAIWVEFAPAVVATSGVIANAKKLFIANSAATSILKSNPYAFKAYLDYKKGCTAIAHHWRSKGFKKVGMLKLNAEFAELCYKGALEVYPDMIVSSYDFGEDLKAQLVRMKSEHVEAIFNTALEADMLNTLKALRALNYQVPVGVTEPEALTEQVRSEYSDMLEGVTSFGFPPVSEDFKKRFNAEYPDASTTALEGAAMSYTHARQLFSAFQACERSDANCLLNQMKDSSPDKTLQFIKWEDRVAAYDFSLKEWKGTELVTLNK